MAKTRRSYTGGAASTTTGSSIASSGTTSFTIAAYTGWPYGSAPFYVVVEPGTSNEEKILVTRTGATDTTINIYATPNVAANRGVDGTTAFAHNSASTVYPVFTATDADEANELASTLTTQGDILIHGASTFGRVGIGTAAQVLKVNSGATAPEWGQVATAGIADDAVTAAKIAANAVGSSELADNAVDTAAIANDAVTAVKIATGAVGSDELASDSVTSAKIADGSVTNAKLGLTEVKLRRAAAQSFSYSASYQYANISWDTEDADASGFITPTSDTLTVPAGASGLYLWSLRFTADLTSGAAFQVNLYNVLVNSVNTFAVASFNAYSNGPPNTVQESSSVYLTAGDTLQFKMRIYTDTASAGDMTATLWLTRIMD